MVRRSLAGLLLLALVLAAALQIPALQDRLIVAGARRHFQQHDAHQALFKDDALRVIVCGSGSPMPDLDRAKACLTVIAGGKAYLVDIGPESSETLVKQLFPVERVAAMFVTHLHSDHIGELGEFAVLSWAYGRRELLDVYGPPGIERVVAGFNEAYALDHDYRTAHHGNQFLPRETSDLRARPVAMPGPEDGRLSRTVLAYRDGDLTVTAIEINHTPVRPAYGYRFDYRGRSVVISGDTAYHPPLAVAARGADILFHESNSSHILELFRTAGKEVPGAERINVINHDVNGYHATPVQAAQVANQAGVRLLALYHVMPPTPVPGISKAWFRGVDEVRPEGVVVTEDRMLFTLPLGGSTIDVSRF
jgi:ribonuclease Z